MKPIFTGKDLFIGRYKTKLGNWIFVFVNEKKHKYEIIVSKDNVNTFMKEYEIQNNIFYINN